MGYIREMPAQEKPREKAIRFGIRTLSNRELLAVLLRTGVRGSSVFETADELLETCGGIGGIGRMSVFELMKIRGISEAKALGLLASFEISRRILFEQTLHRDVVNEPAKMIRWLQSELGSELQEMFLAVYLDTACHILDYRVLFVGTINASLVYPREVFREALLRNCVNIMLVHNHPSGDLTPSTADIAMTDRLVEAGQIVGVRVLDHLIVTQNGYLSFAQEELIAVAGN